MSVCAKGCSSDYYAVGFEGSHLDDFFGHSEIVSLPTKMFEDVKSLEIKNSKSFDISIGGLTFKTTERHSGITPNVTVRKTQQYRVSVSMSQTGFLEQFPKHLRVTLEAFLNTRLQLEKAKVDTLKYDVRQISADETPQSQTYLNKIGYDEYYKL